MNSEILKDQVAVVTGASRGIGRAIAKDLALQGAHVVINYARSSAEAQRLATEIHEQGGKALLCQFDVGDEQGVVAGFEKVVSELGGIHILVNNAGIAVDGLFVRTKTEDWQKTMSVNLNGVFLCSRAAAKTMMKQRYGRILNMSSVIGLMGNAGQVAYAATKSALFGFTKSLARELGSRGITVNCIAPGYIVTDMTGAIKEEQKQQLTAQIPLGRLGTVEDISHAVSFLASPGASYITGEILSVNGGMYMA
jgi:3-oxoacyl-[acyl-carrier protein] reductase